MFRLQFVYDKTPVCYLQLPIVLQRKEFPGEYKPSYCTPESKMCRKARKRKCISTHSWGECSDGTSAWRDIFPSDVSEQFVRRVRISVLSRENFQPA